MIPYGMWGPMWQPVEPTIVPKSELQYPTLNDSNCQHPGCFSIAHMYAADDEAQFDRVCKLCFDMLSVKDQAHYVDPQ
jgi:hypothetical protein